MGVGVDGLPDVCGGERRDFILERSNEVCGYETGEFGSERCYRATDEQHPQ